MFLALMLIPAVAAAIAWLIINESNDRAGHPMRQDTEDSATALVVVAVWAAVAYWVLLIGTAMQAKGGG
jgi:hypothetical protein